MKEAVPLLKVTVAPAPMLSELRVWLTLPNFSAVPVPETFTMEVPEPRVPLTLVVPPFAVRSASTPPARMMLSSSGATDSRLHHS